MLNETQSARYMKRKFFLFFIYSPLIDYKFEKKKNILLKGVKGIQGRREFLNHSGKVYLHMTEKINRTKYYSISQQQYYMSIKWRYIEVPIMEDQINKELCGMLLDPFG